MEVRISRGLLASRVLHTNDENFEGRRHGCKVLQRALRFRCDADRAEKEEEVRVCWLRSTGFPSSNRSSRELFRPAGRVVYRARSPRKCQRCVIKVSVCAGICVGTLGGFGGSFSTGTCSLAARATCAEKRKYIYCWYARTTCKSHASLKAPLPTAQQVYGPGLRDHRILRASARTERQVTDALTLLGCPDQSAPSDSPV